MRGFKTKQGSVFTTSLQIVRNAKYSRIAVVIAEPGDLINVEGAELQNLTRVIKGNAPFRFPLHNARLVWPMAC